MRWQETRGFSLVETLIALAILSAAMAAVFGLLVSSAQINKSQQLTADVLANARNCLSMVVQKLHRAGWDPENAGFAALALDPDTTDDVSQIEIFADLNSNGNTNQNDEQVLIRHTGTQVEWRRRAADAFRVLATDISNDADGDGTLEPMFVPIPNPSPTRIRVQVTAESPILSRGR